jgi:hypothetical protein
MHKKRSPYLQQTKTQQPFSCIFPFQEVLGSIQTRAKFDLQSFFNGLRDRPNPKNRRSPAGPKAMYDKYYRVWRRNTPRLGGRRGPPDRHTSCRLHKGWSEIVDLWGLGGPGDSEIPQKPRRGAGGASPPPFGTGVGASGIAQTQTIDDIRPAQKPCVKNTSLGPEDFATLRSHFGSAVLAFLRSPDLRNEFVGTHGP